MHHPQQGSDAELWSAASRGDGRAFRQVLERHGDRVFRHAWHIVRNTADAEEVTSTVFTQAWRKRNRVRLVRGSILPWLLATTTYVAKNATRAARRNRRLLAMVPAAEVAPDPVEQVIARADDVHARSLVGQALAQLSDADAQLISLVLLEEVPVKDAAHVLGISQGTASVRLHRARTRLRARLQEAGYGTELEAVQ